MLAFSEISLSFKNARDEKKFPGLERVWDYLAKRGVDRKTADLCGLHIMQAVELIAAARKSPNINAVDNRAAVVFPHYRLGDMNQPMEWWSSRLVPIGDQSGLRVVASFGDLVDPTKTVKVGKMFCPPNEPPHGYFPPVYAWKSLAKGQRVFIHESALKALNGALLGEASVGLNGVWGWSSRKHGIALIEELRDLPWKALELQPVIVYDSNAWDNWQVQAAESGLAGRIFEITGRMAFALRVPKPDGGGDEGFDDFRMRVGDTAAREFLQGEGTPIDINEIELMKMDLNSQVCVVRSMGVVAEQATATLMSGGVFMNLNYAHFTATVEHGETVRQVNVPKLWLADTRRAEVERLEYAPGEGRLIRTTEGSGLPMLNTWRGMGCDPEPGDVDIWLELLVNGVPDDELRQWLLSWLAYPLQNPGKKLTAYPLVFGPSGVGKNLFFKPLHHAYGDNAVIIGKDNILSSFNSIYANKQFIHLDELQRARGDGEDQVTQKVKMLTTGETMVVNTKGVKEYSVRNVANLVITSNYWDCIKLDSDDRRATVLRWDPSTSGGVDRRGDQEYWIRYVQWVERGGFRAVYQFLMEHELGSFNPAAWAPDTVWKEQVKQATMTPIESFVADLWNDPDAVLGLASVSKPLFTAKELCVMFYNMGEAEISPSKSKVMADALRNKGFKQANGGKMMRREGANPAAFWVIRRRDEEWDIAKSAHILRTIKS